MSNVQSVMNRKIHTMSTDELGKLFPIIIDEHNPLWPISYQKEKKLILNAFSDSEIVCIDHIGSTAIPNLKAKPTIDI